MRNHASPLRKALALLFIAMVLIACAALGGCSNAGSTKPPAVLAQCDAICYVPCVTDDGDTGIRWDGSPVDAAAWDALADRTTLALGDALRVCDTHRKACVQCLNRLEANKVIVQ